MSEQINPGDGYRLIDKHTDKPREGDQYLYWNRWRDRPKPLDPWDFTHTYRRRIPAKPEAIKIRHTLIKCNSFNDVMRATNQDVSLLVGNADEARQLADWLTRYADWREAQDAAK